jgi:broad specificity phosphatase PhoE
MTTKLILIRHGETEKNVAGKLHSAKDAEELTEIGKEQMQATGRFLKRLRPSIIYSSEEKRANESAKILSEHCNIPFVLTKGLEERDWGDFSGKEWDKIKAVLDPMSLEERYTYIPPKGESWEGAEERMIKAIEMILKQNKEKTVAVVTHGGTIRILMPYFLGAPKEETFRHDPDNASLTIFDYLKGTFKKIKVNDTPHLRVSK